MKTHVRFGQRIITCYAHMRSPEAMAHVINEGRIPSPLHSPHCPWIKRKRSRFSLCRDAKYQHAQAIRTFSLLTISRRSDILAIPRSAFQTCNPDVFSVLWKAHSGYTTAEKVEFLRTFVFNFFLI